MNSAATDFASLDDLFVPWSGRLDKHDIRNEPFWWINFWRDDFPDTVITTPQPAIDKRVVITEPVKVVRINHDDWSDTVSLQDDFVPEKKDKARNTVVPRFRDRILSKLSDWILFLEDWIKKNALPKKVKRELNTLMLSNLEYDLWTLLKYLRFKYADGEMLDKWTLMWLVKQRLQWQWMEQKEYREFTAKLFWYTQSSLDIVLAAFSLIYFSIPNQRERLLELMSIQEHDEFIFELVQLFNTQEKTPSFDFWWIRNQVQNIQSR